MAHEKDPFAQPYKVALYKELTGGWTHVSHFYEGEGVDDATYHGDSVRISEPYAVPFRPLSDEKVVESALKTLAVAEKNLLDEFQQKLNTLKEQRSRFLALTHQPESAS
jgi:hypothetical protein